MENKTAKEAREQIRLLLHYDGQDVHELVYGTGYVNTDNTVAL